MQSGVVGQRVSEPGEQPFVRCAIVPVVAFISDRARSAEPQDAFDRARRYHAARGNRKIKPLAAQLPKLAQLFNHRPRPQAGTVAHAWIDPQPVDVAIALQHPGVVVIGEHMDFGLRQSAPQMLKHWRDEQHVAHFVALEDDNFHVCGTERCSWVTCVSAVLVASRKGHAAGVSSRRVAAWA